MDTLSSYLDPVFLTTEYLDHQRLISDWKDVYTQIQEGAELCQNKYKIH